MKVDEGREGDAVPQCLSCTHCKEDDAAYEKFRRGSAFRCDALGRLLETHHMDVPGECHCKGKNYLRKQE